MKDIKNSLERYYQGESTLAEEQFLKKQFCEGTLSEEPIFSFHKAHPELSIDLQQRITTAIHNKKRVKRKYHLLYVSSVAAVVVLALFIRELMTPTIASIPIQQQKECFEDAIQTIGRALNETQYQNQSILYKDDYITIYVK